MVEDLLCTFIQIYVIAMFARIVLGFFPISPNSALAPVFSFLYNVTEPVLGPIRRLMPPLSLGGAGIDLSPLIVVLVAQILQRSLCVA